jgi:uracil-DNA glycosylase
VDARAQLRRYLEQRREAGETELVLDGLTVEEVMRLLGAAASRDATSGVSEQPVDWRAALRDSDARTADSPQPPARLSAPQPGGADRSRPPERLTAPLPDKASRNQFDESSPVRSDTPAERSGVESHATIPLDQIPTGLTVGADARELFGGPASRYGSLDELVQAVAGCTKCPLSKSAKNPVPGEGSPTAGLMCVGEAPGAVEDETGRPFVGPAGQLLDKILAAITLSRNDVYICNVLKHRPPGNRNPTPDEVEACSPYLLRQIELIAPKVIVAFGTFAAQTLLNTKDAISRLRGKVHHYYGVPLVVTYHPAALLRNPGWKRPTWEDVQLARRLLDRAISP